MAVGFAPIDSNAKVGPALPIAICLETAARCGNCREFRDPHDQYISDTSVTIDYLALLDSRYCTTVTTHV